MGQKENNNLERSILRTLSYFDIFNFPMTITEIWRWGMYKEQNNRIKDIVRALEASEYLDDRVDNTSGFFYLKGREKLVELRRTRHLIAQPRWKKLKRVITILQAVPFIKMIAACNTLAIHDIKPTSDIDVFIIIKSGRIWMTRFMTTFIVGLLGQWRHKNNIAKKLCLSFYVTDDNMNFKPIAKEPYDIYLQYWIALVSPLLDRGVYDNFLKNNGWIKESLDNVYKYQPIDHERKMTKIRSLDRVRKVGERLLLGRFGDRVEVIFRKFQKGKMDKNYGSMAKKNTSDVIINDKMLKFHEVDKREEFRKKYERRYSEAQA